MSQIETMMVRNFIILCWLGFVAYWMAYGWKVKKTVEKISVAGRLRYKIWLYIATILLAVPFRDYPFSYMVIPHSAVSSGVGCALCLLGLLGAIWARRTLAGNWSADVTLKENHELIVRGPYHFVRHPIYTTLLLMFLGTAIAQGRLAAFASVPFCFISFWIKLKQEEKLMLRHFPTEYPAYQNRVKALVPFVL